MDRLKRIICAVMLAGLMLPAMAVTEKEMEEARTITAQAYLRYANDGSGYLDDIKVTSMKELESKLKAQEKENIKAFKSVAVPSDYASWDKARLVEFWSVKFFASPELTAKGKVAKTRVKRRLEAMKIGAPATEEKKQEVKPEEKPADNAAETPSAVADVRLADNTIAAESSALAEDKQDILADQKAVEEDKELMEENFKPEKSYTWIYIVVLVILVGVVVWLVVFASNVMKRKDEPQDKSGEIIDSESRPVKKNYAHQEVDVQKVSAAAVAEAEDRIREKFAGSLAAKNDELKAANARIQGLEQEIANIRIERAQLKEQVAMLKEKLGKSSSRKVSDDASAGAAPILKVIYLGRVNQRGMFIRADRKISIGNTIYRLDTNDGFVGTFTIADDPTIDEMIIMEPEEMLAGGCTGDFSNAAEAQHVVTDAAGTAVFENGCWKVLRKARVHFE